MEEQLFSVSLLETEGNPCLLYLTLASTLERFLVHENDQEFTEKHEEHIVTMPTRNVL